MISLKVDLGGLNKMDMYIGIATKLIIGAIGIFTVMRIVGKKAISEITPFDILYVILLGAVVEEAIYDDKVNVLHVLFATALWGAFVYTVELILQKSEKGATITQGQPSVLIHKGKLNLLELEKNHFDMEQLRTLLRSKDVYSINDVYYAILEVSGQVTVITKDKMRMPTLLFIEGGQIKTKTLKEANKDTAWLISELSKKDFNDISKILYCEYDIDKDEMYVETYDNTIQRKITIED